MQQQLGEIKEDLDQLVAMSADLVRASQQQTLTEAQGQRMEQGLERLERVVEAQGQRMERSLESLVQVTQVQGQQMLAVVQQLAQVIDRLVPEHEQ